MQYVKEKRDYITTSPLAKATPIVYEQWKAAHTKFLDKVDQTKENLRKDYTYKISVDDAFKRLEAVYTDIEAAIPAKVAGLSDVAGADWRHTIAAHVATAYRENAFKDLMAALPAPSPDVPNTADQSFVSKKDQILKNLEKSRTDTLALIADYTTILDRLDHLDLQPNEPAPNASYWRDLSDKWTSAKNPLLADQVISAALKPHTDRVGALRDIDAITDYKLLLAQAQSPKAEIALTAWRRLGAIPVTDDPSVLKDEEDLQTRLSTQFKNLAALDAPRQQKLAAELTDQGRIRWRRWVDVIKTASSIQIALDKIAAFSITLSPQTDAKMIFNQTFYNLRKDMGSNPSVEQLTPIANKFLTNVDAMPAAIKDTPDIKNLLEAMKKSLDPKLQQSSAKGAGPELAKWQKEDQPDKKMQVFYFPDKANAKYTLTFVRMERDDKYNIQKTVYLCTTETPVGLFIDTLNTFGKIDELDNDALSDHDKHPELAHWFKIPALKKDDVYLAYGPRSWKIDGRKFALNDNWLDNAGPLMMNQPYYPANATPPKPRINDPMQLISPWAAIYAAQLLGCRLPTSTEWKKAYDEYDTAAGLPKDIWNLRGEGPISWRTQQEHTRQMEKNGLPYPDKGIFIPGKLVFADIFADKAAPWTANALAKIAPNRFSASPASYQNNTLWFQEIDKETAPAGAAPPALTFHHLVGNVAEYVFDGATATEVIKDNVPKPVEIDKALGDKANAGAMFVVGGSSLSPPDIPFNEKQTLSLSSPAAKIGFCDVGFRLAYTAPIDSIVDVLVNAFKEPKYLPPH